MDSIPGTSTSRSRNVESAVGERVPIVTPTAAINDQLATLIDADILARYTHEPSEAKRVAVLRVHGAGVEILYDYKYLRGLPAARTLYENIRKTEKTERHESAPRLKFLDAVVDALAFDEPDLDAADVGTTS